MDEKNEDFLVETFDKNGKQTFDNVLLKKNGSSERFIANIPKNILKLIEDNQQGIKLDIGGGFNPQKGFVNLDIRDLDGVDIVHNAESIPYPLPSECCGTILASHLIEHICPRRFISVMNEWWRIMKPGGQLLISCPHGRSDGMLQDPSHCLAVNETTFTYFDYTKPLYHIYKPKPWEIKSNVWFENGNIEVIMEKVLKMEVER